VDAGVLNLKQWLHRRKVSPREFLAIGVQLAEALVGLHGRKIIHRDINPWNVVVDPHGRATLLDVEAATALPGGDARAGVPARLGGELSYVAPEETGRMNRLVDQRADLYSLGAVFYEMLTGSPPFVSGDPVQLVHAHLAREPVPPVQGNPTVPVVLSDMVVKLLAKTPEGRYQSAAALLADLREAQDRLDRQGAIAPFELGLVDVAQELPMPERLYQRESQRAALLAAWEQAAAGASRVVILAGPAGSGKSALAGELREPVVRRHGRLLTAKFDEQRARAPYAPFAEAFHGLVADLLNRPPAETAAWRRRLEHALGQNARVMTDLAPELERLLGTPPPIAAVGAVETESRLHLVFQAFIRALAAPEHPLVLFLDDVQWADTASLRLLEVLATAPDLSPLLLVVALRPEECAADSIAGTTVAALSRPPSGQRIDLPPLTQEAVVQFCCDTLRCDADRARPLATLVLDKTGGNPFFIRRMVRFLYQSGLLTFDGASRTWTWDLAEIEQIDVSENVVDLLLVVLKELPEPVQEVIRISACIGHTVSLGLLASVCGLVNDEAARRLWTAVRAGLLVPLDRSDEPRASFRFAHDRIRQAAYLLFDEPARKRIHVRIGRQLLRDSDDEHVLDERLYTIVDHFDQGLELITEPEQRQRLSQLNLRAARKARGSSAHGPALDYLKCALALLPDDAWVSHHQGTFDLHREAVETAGFVGDLSLSDDLFLRALGRARSAVERADLYTVRTYASIAQDAKEQAFQWGLKGLRELGVELPVGDPQPATARELAAIQSNLNGRTPAQLLELPHMRAEQHLASMKLLSTVSDAVYFHHPELFPFVTARMVNLSLEHGNAVFSALAYAAYAVLLGLTGRDYQVAHAFGRFSLDLAAQFDDPVREMKVMAIFASLVNNWTAPLHTTLPLSQDGQRQALQVGDTYFASAFSVTEMMVRFHQGTTLGQLVAPLRAAISVYRKARFQPGVEEHLVLLGGVHLLQGTSLPEDVMRAAGTGLDDRGFPPDVGEASGKLPEYQVFRLGIACLLRDFGLAIELSNAVAGKLQSLPRFVQHVEYNFYSALARAARASRATGDERAALMAAIAANQEQLAVWAGSNPESYGHKQLIVAAELARLRGDAQAAAELYDRAITAAEREQFTQDEGLASELCGRFYLTQGRKRSAAPYLSAAIDAFARWGAGAKVDALEAEFVDVLVSAGRPPAPGARGPTHDQTGGVALDLLALFRAAEAVSSEVVLPRLLGKLMEVCLATAGAERGVFVIDEDGQLFVRAVGAVAEPISLQRTALAESAQLPGQVVQDVCRTGEALVVGDASAHEQLASDPYVAAHGVRSLLALPILRQAKLMGALYLENNLATRAFTPERVRLLLTLSSQIATSLQNSLLFEKLNQEIGERKRAEAAVRFLADAGAALSESLEYQSTLKQLTQLAVPFLADWCTVHVVEDGVVQWVASAHVDPDKQALLSRQAQMEIGQQLSVADPEGSVLPLWAHGRFLGAMTLGSRAPGRRFEAPAVAVAEELARRAALAIDNARLYREAREAIRLRDEFLSVASHELNTPIASLRLVSQSFERMEGVPSAAELSKLVNIISRQSNRLASLVGDILDVGQIPAGNFTLRREPVELTALVRETVEQARGEIDRTRSRLVLKAGEELVGYWDRARIQKAIGNLLSNAIKFGPGKDIEVVVAGYGHGWARLIVEDHGLGIPPERLPHIFGRFERAVSAMHYGGLGLGLYIVRAVVEAHGGRVDVTSAPGEGAKFTVDLPLAATTAG
jgi:predicted ATPase/signal transduction histidine kinase